MLHGLRAPRRATATYLPPGGAVDRGCRADARRRVWVEGQAAGGVVPGPPRAWPNQTGPRAASGPPPVTRRALDRGLDACAGGHPTGACRPRRRTIGFKPAGGLLALVRRAHARGASGGEDAGEAGRGIPGGRPVVVAARRWGRGGGGTKASGGRRDAPLPGAAGTTSGPCRPRPRPAPQGRAVASWSQRSCAVST